MIDYLVIFLVSMIPLIELRGAVIISQARGLPVITSFIICIIGNMLPVPFIYLFARKVLARANIMWAGMMAHNNSCGVGRSQDWTSHQIEHELSALYDCAHGAGLAVTMP